MPNKDSFINVRNCVSLRTTDRLQHEEIQNLLAEHDALVAKLEDAQTQIRDAVDYERELSERRLQDMDARLGQEIERWREAYLRLLKDIADCKAFAPPPPIVIDCQSTAEIPVTIEFTIQSGN